MRFLGEGRRCVTQRDNAPYVKWHFGSRIVNPSGSSYAKLWTKDEFKAAFGVEPNDFSNYCISMYNGDLDANGALINPSVSRGSNIMYAHFSYSFTGNCRINWTVGAYTTG